MKRVQIKGAFFLIICLGLLLTVNSLGRMVVQSRQSPIQDLVTLSEKRFAPLKAVLPKKGTLGYVAYPELKSLTDIPGAQKYYLAQYALSPVCLDYQHDHPLSLGNFEGGIPQLFLQEKNLIVVQDFGNGVFLLKKGNP